VIGRSLGAGSTLALTLALAVPAESQVVAGGGVDYRGYSFDEGLGADAAQLFMVPIAVRIPAGDRLMFDVFGAWAEGRVEQDNQVFGLSGPVDTSVKASLQATPWALVSVSANVPTGNSAHNGEEAIVASVLSTDLLGFRETTWGTGGAVTTSVASAATAGGFGIGVAAAYAVRAEFEPSADDPTLTYQPGNESRVRVGLDRNFGTSTLTAGATFVTYTDDKARGRNLFQAGNRLRFDASYAFRAGAGAWSIYAADLMRENGDLTLDIVDQNGDFVGDTTVVTAKQNLIVGGVIGTIGIGGGYVFRPHIDYKYQRREETDGNDAGSGWMLAAGGDIPIRLAGTEFFPKARVYFGSIRDVTGTDVSTVGMEFNGTFRFNF